MERIIAEISERITELLKIKKRILIAIDGSCASGKSTLGEELAKRYGCNLFHMDDFFLRPEQRTPARLAEIGGNVDYERFRQAVLLPLKAGSPFSYQPYDCSTGSLRAPVEVIPKKVNVIEGSYSHHPYFGDPYDVKVFLQVSPEVRAERIGRRPAFLQKRFFEEWIPMEQRYFETFDIAGRADMTMVPADNQ